MFESLNAFIEDGRLNGRKRQARRLIRDSGLRMRDFVPYKGKAYLILGVEMDREGNVWAFLSDGTENPRNPYIPAYIRVPLETLIATSDTAASLAYTAPRAKRRKPLRAYERSNVRSAPPGLDKRSFGKRRSANDNDADASERRIAA